MSQHKYPTVSVRVTDMQSLVDAARGGPEEDYVIYEFGAGEKVFTGLNNPSTIFDKPTAVGSDGAVIHLPDPNFDF